MDNWLLPKITDYWDWTKNSLEKYAMEIMTASPEVRATSLNAIPAECLPVVGSERETKSTCRVRFSVGVRSSHTRKAVGEVMEVGYAVFCCARPQGLPVRRVSDIAWGIGLIAEHCFWSDLKPFQRLA